MYDPYNETLVNFVMERCAKSIRIANCTYFSLNIEMEFKKIRCNQLITLLIRTVPNDIYTVIMDVNNFAKTIEDNYVGDQNPDEPISGIEKIGMCVSPTHPELGKKIVVPTVMKCEQSANKPVPILLAPSLSDVSNNEAIKADVLLFKREDLRTDAIVMNIIRMMRGIVEENTGIDLHVVTYNVQPTSKDSGFIAAVGDCETLYTIEEKLKLSLANYVRKHNPDTSDKVLKERFMHSCAFYSVITFLLGIGDRHLDNIMLTKDGRMFHIDFGFILGKDPRPMKIPHMRITEGMLDAIGGFHSESYEEFKELSYIIYDILRRHVNTFVCLLSLLPKQNIGGTWTNPHISDNRVFREIIKRFAPGETYSQAKTLLHTKIDKSTNITSSAKNIAVDFFHRHNKEGTVRNVLSSTVESTYSGTKSMVKGVWDYLYGN